MAAVTITTNVPEVAAAMRGLFSRQVPFALKNAINASAVTAQAEQRKRQRAIFTVRRPAFVDRAVKIRPFATKSKPMATIRIEPPGGAKRADILGKFETERIKRPTGERLAVPVEARRSKAGIVQRGQRPRALNLQEFARAPGKVILRGEKRTFAVLKPGGRGGIYQSVGKGKRRQVRTLFRFTPQAEITPDLRFVDTIVRSLDKTFVGDFAREFEKAIAKARR